MRFKAKLLGSLSQSHCPTLASAREWAGIILKKEAAGVVEIYEIREALVDVLTKEKEEKIAETNV